MLPNKFVIVWDNRPVALDSGSGGYPFKTDHPSEVKYWESREEAQKYMDIFIAEGKNWKIVEIQFHIMDSK
jgi:hypothetical protein